MTIDWSKYPPIPGFDSMKWKDERQATILRETKGMTREEYFEYLRKGSEEFREKQRIRRAERQAQAVEDVA